jgi:hypothetical protein
LRLAKYLRLDVNYIYQTVSHQAFEAIHLGLVEEGLKCLRMIYDKVYEEGYPWEMSLFGLPGFNYMTHPVMWGFLNAMTGAALDLPGRTLHLAPKLFPGIDTLRLPVFFPRFWLAVEFPGLTGQGSVRVIRVIGEQDRQILLERLLLTLPDDSVRQIDLKRFPVEMGAALEFYL